MKQLEDIPFFIAPDAPQSLVLPPEESAHAARVLRLKSGAPIHLTDGGGRLFRAIIAAPDPRETHLFELEELSCTPPPSPRLHIAIAPTKNADRIEWLVEKLTEVGVQELSFITTARTIRRHTNTTRLEKIILAAAKQSRKVYLPTLRTFTKGIEEFFSFMEGKIPPNAFIAYCDEEIPRCDIHHCFKPQEDSLILIGPEGDFTPDEVRIALSKSIRAVSLGEERLRTETAGLYAGFLHHILRNSK